MTTMQKDIDRALVTDGMAKAIFISGSFDGGVAHDELVRCMSLSEPGQSRKYFEGVVRRELARDGLVRLPSGNYTVGPRDRDERQRPPPPQPPPQRQRRKSADKKARTSSSNGSSRDSPPPLRRTSKASKPPPPSKTKPTATASSKSTTPIATTNKPTNDSGIRVGERAKRAKKVFDPSENDAPKKKRPRPTTAATATGAPSANSNNSKSEKVAPPPPPPPAKKSQSQQPFQATPETVVVSLTPSQISVASSAPKQSSQPLKTYGRKRRSASVGIGGGGSGNSSEDEEAAAGDGPAPATATTYYEVGSNVRGAVCTVCKQYCCQRDGSYRLVSCNDCSNKAHPPCLQGGGMLKMRPDNTWQCPMCKTCVVCTETSDAGELTVCHLCADAYHSLCATPRIPERQNASSDWECRECRRAKNSNQNMVSSYTIQSMRNYNNNNNNNSAARDSSTTPDEDTAEPEDAEGGPEGPEGRAPRRGPEATSSSDSQELYDAPTQLEAAPLHKKTKKKNSGSGSLVAAVSEGADSNKVDPSIPDVTDWTCDRVYEYFCEYFPEYAHKFKDEQIDGYTLKAMTRYHVCREMGFPLGPAIKIYRHVVKLQSRRDDFRMVWF